MAVKLLDAATTTGVSPAWRIQDGVLDHTVQGTCTGNPTAIETHLEGSLDGSTWYQLAGHAWNNGDLSSQQTMFHVTSKYVRYVRVNIDIFSGGTSPTITLLYDGDGN